MLGNYQVSTQLVVSRVVLSYMELVSQLVCDVIFGTDCTMTSLKLRLCSWTEELGGKGDSGVQYNIDRPMRYQAILSALRLFKLSTSICPYLTVCVENTRLKRGCKKPS
jgi:hypothetical protein